MSKKLLFRADGNNKTGLGHVYRLLGLVEMFRKDYECVFVTTSSTPDSIFPKEYTIVTIPEETNILNESDWLVNHFSPKDCIIICDGYHFVSKYQKEVKKKGYRLIYIDDLVSEYMHADVVVNHSPEIKDTDYRKENYTKLALGTRYALLRTEFLNQLSEERIAKKEKNVFVCFGGSDPKEFSYKVVRSLLQVDKVEKIFVILGAANKGESLRSLQEKNPEKILLLRNLSAGELLDIMLKSYLAIVPSSTILYELCCSSTPCLSGYYVENQRRIHDGFEKKEAIYSMGDISGFDIENFTEHIKKVLEKGSHKAQLENQRRMFDTDIKSRYLKLIKELC